MKEKIILDDGEISRVRNKITITGIKKRTWDILETTKLDDKVSRIFDIAILTLIFFNVIATIIGSVQEIQKQWEYFLMFLKRCQ